jgi:hypothetical protein
LQPGDLVLSRDENDPAGAVMPKVVEEVFVREAFVLELQVGGRVIRTTAEHPFYVRGKGWVPAALLQVGDPLCCLEGDDVRVEALRDTGEFQRVHNCRIADWHTYFVGCQEWGFSVWAHNEYKSGKTVQQAADELEAAGIPRPIADRLAKVGAISGVAGDEMLGKLAGKGKRTEREWEALARKVENLADEIERSRNDIREKLKSPLLRVGSNAKDSISTTNHDINSVTAQERAANNINGNKNGDHHYPNKRVPEAASGWIPDHQPVTELVLLAQRNPELMSMMKEAELATSLNNQVLLPHALSAAREQGGTITAITSKLKAIDRRLTKINGIFDEF